MILSLDSNVLVDVMRANRPHVRARLTEAIARGSSIKVSTVVAQELVFGAHLSHRIEHQLRLVGDTLAEFGVEAWTWEDALATGRLRAEMRRQVGPIGAYDRLIAGQCLARGWTLVTADVTDFIRVGGLPIVDWSNPAGAIDVTGAMTRSRRPSED